MKDRYRLIYRGERGSMYYCVDSVTGHRVSLKTKDRAAAKNIVFAKNESLRQPAINLQLAKAYLSGSDSGAANQADLTRLKANQQRQNKVALPPET